MPLPQPRLSTARALATQARPYRVNFATATGTIIATQPGQRFVVYGMFVWSFFVAQDTTHLKARSGATDISPGVPISGGLWRAGEGSSGSLTVTSNPVFVGRQPGDDFILENLQTPGQIYGMVWGLVVYGGNVI